MKFQLQKLEVQHTKRKVFQMILKQQIQVHHPLLQSKISGRKSNNKKSLQRQKNQGLMLFKSFKNYRKNIIEAPCIIGTSKNIQIIPQMLSNIKKNNTSIQSPQYRLNRCNTCQINKRIQLKEQQSKIRNNSSACQPRINRKTILSSQQKNRNQNNKKIVTLNLNVNKQQFWSTSPQSFNNV